ncbi:hypothetical protein Dimus_034557 [Dionaea muscipula]
MCTSPSSVPGPRGGRRTRKTTVPANYRNRGCLPPIDLNASTVFDNNDNDMLGSNSNGNSNHQHPPPDHDHPLIPPANGGVEVEQQQQQQQQQQSKRRKKARRVDSSPIPPPYPWATERRAMVYSLIELQEKGIETITGTVKCDQCGKEYEIEYNLKVKFFEVAKFIADNRDMLHDRAPSSWKKRNKSPPCRYCHPPPPPAVEEPADQQKQVEEEDEDEEEKIIMSRVKPVISKKRNINWLFLFLGNMLGFCKLPQLRYFCKHTGNHRTGASDRLLYLTYLGICKQLDPAPWTH